MKFYSKRKKVLSLFILFLFILGCGIKDINAAQVVDIEVITSRDESENENKEVEQITKVIFSAVEKNNILDTGTEAYLREVAYFFSKFGFRNVPIAYVMLENEDDIYHLNKEWMIQQADNNLDTGVMFNLIVYENEFDVDNFENLLNDFRDDILVDLVPNTGIESVELRKFKVDADTDPARLEYEGERLEQIKINEIFSSIDFEDKNEPNITLNINNQNISADQSTVEEVNFILSNESNFDYIFSSDTPLEISTPQDTQLFLNDEWLSPRTVHRIDNGFVRANSQKEIAIEIQVPMVPGDYDEEFELILIDEVISQTSVSVESKDTGLDILRVRPTGLGYLRIREESNTTSEEVGRAAENLYYEYIDTENGFYKIKYNEEGSEGWISGNYVDIIN